MNLPKVYEPGQYESDIYALWEKTGAFQPSNAKESYSIVVPPPNANGNLHIGHALTAGLEDIAVRYHRLKGKSALFLPGADHAGFETQVVYEKHLAKEGKSRFDFSREELYSNIWDFVAENRTKFETQFRRLGASVDWSRNTFTLDDNIVKRAYATFKKMWDEGLIYRGERLVNYCTYHRTGFADIEVEYKDQTTPLYYMKYGPFTLATTRPETKFGDTAVAVHPDDKRYKEWVNKVITVEGLNGPFEIRVVSDEMVDPNFGTGAVKITPAHDLNDWEVSQRHNLAVKRVINHDGTLNHLAGEFEGMTVKEARKAVVKALDEKGLLVKVDKNYKNRVGHCYKCDTVIEPMLMKQWFIDMQPLAKPAIEALKKRKIEFYPDTKREQLITYLENLRDWNISRQITWGIPIPAFQNIDDSDDWIFDENVAEELIEKDGKTYRRDPDVFDTWFSSGSWPYATLNYPGEDFEKFYPLNLMETGFDILYPWVSRMLMMGLYVTGKIPFKKVYLHGLVLDEHGQKMSKSKGNVVSPIALLDKYGSDALRMGLIAGQTAGNNQPFNEPRVLAARNFCNKLWNIARYVEDKIGNKQVRKPHAKTAADHWILDRLGKTSQQMADHIEDYCYAEAYDLLYHFVWDDFADWYIEASKAEENLPLLSYALENILKIAHPYAPFVTETIWQTLAWEPDSLLITSKWPEVPEAETKIVKSFEDIKSIVTEARGINKALGISDVTLHFNNSPIVEQNAELIRRLARLKDVKPVSATETTGLKLTQTSYSCWLDIDAGEAKAYASELEQKGKIADESIAKLKARLDNKQYVNNAPEAVIQQTKDALQAAREQLAAIQAEYDRFSNL
jgi:valyl-tRNA synthetase